MLHSTSAYSKDPWTPRVSGPHYACFRGMIAARENIDRAISALCDEVEGLVTNLTYEQVSRPKQVCWHDVSLLNFLQIMGRFQITFKWSGPDKEEGGNKIPSFPPFGRGWLLTSVQYKIPFRSLVCTLHLYPCWACKSFCSHICCIY